LDKLDKVLLSLYKNNLEADFNTSNLTGFENKVIPKWPKLVRRMTEYGISEAEAEQNQELILKWGARAFDIAASPPLKQSSTTDSLMGSVGINSGLGAHKEEVEVFSALYGPRNATDRIRHIINAPSGLKMTKVVFSATNETFGGDPWSNCKKAFSLVWRKVI
jgi:hypothetical protein